MNENNNDPVTPTPPQLNVSHFWLLNRKQFNHLRGLDDECPLLLQHKASFYSGVYAALSFMRLSAEMREENNNLLIDDCHRKFYDPSLVEMSFSELLTDLVTMTGVNLSEMQFKLEQLLRECEAELEKLKTNNEQNK